MSLPLHLILHVVVSVFIGLLVFKKYGRLNLAGTGAILGGVLVDLDHLLDYFLAFGFHFNLHYFLIGNQFLESNKIYILFHAWEYVGLLIIIYYLLTIRKKTVLAIFVLALSLGIGGHLIVDTIVNDVKPQTYFLTYRLAYNFDAKYLVYPKYWKNDQQLRKEVSF